MTDEVDHTQIRWTSRPVPRLEDVDGAELLALEPAELLAFAADLQADLRAVRELLQQALGMLAEQQKQIAQLRRQNERPRAVAG
jgi:hypothetical protein